jgi:hypothetical protein
VSFGNWQGLTVQPPNRTNCCLAASYVIAEFKRPGGRLTDICTQSGELKVPGDEATGRLYGLEKSAVLGGNSDLPILAAEARGTIGR